MYNPLRSIKGRRVYFLNKDPFCSSGFFFSPSSPRLLKATAKGRRERGKGKICLAVRIVAAKDAGFTDKSTLTSVHLNTIASECLKTSFPCLVCFAIPC